MLDLQRVQKVSSFLFDLKNAIHSDPRFVHVSLEGEISDARLSSSGFFFTLKDNDGALSCVIWPDIFSRLHDRKFKNGDQVIVNGSLDLWSKRGTLSFRVTDIYIKGLGEALLKLEELKKKLFDEGLFSDERKMKLPLFPKKIAIIVAENSAAEADLKKNILERFPLIELDFVYATVQGKSAPQSLMRAYRFALKLKPDLLIIARGGGSNDDLSAFNDEQLARLLSTRSIPLISAIGHEIDWTIIDLIADFRVSTPTGAAQKAVPDYRELLYSLSDNSSSLDLVLIKRLREERKHLALLSMRPFLKDPLAAYSVFSERLKHLKERLMSGINKDLEQKTVLLAKFKKSLAQKTIREYLSRKNSRLAIVKVSSFMKDPSLLINERIEKTINAKKTLEKVLQQLIQRKNEKIKEYEARLNNASPQAIINRGYAIVESEKGAIIRSVKDVSNGDRMNVTIKDGKILSVVEEVNNE